MKLLALFCFVACGLTGCAVGDRMLADPHDYQQYRATRLAASQPARLWASGRYLERFPEGRFRGEVSAWFARYEPEYLRLAHDRPSLLRAYLRELPNGPHARDVKARLAEFELVNEYNEQREARSSRLIERAQRELDSARDERERVMSTFEELVRLAASTRSFGAPTSELDHRLIYRFRLEPKAGVCAGDLCSKRFDLPYAVPTPRGFVERRLFMELELELDAGLLRRITLRGPALFSRLAEAHDRVLVQPTDLLGRTEAIARAANLVQNASEAALPSSECARDVVAPVVLMRQCRGVRLTVSAALEAHELDRIEVAAFP